MACMAEDQRFPSAGGHDLYPSRLLPTCVLFQVFERSDVVGSGAVVPCGDRPSPALRTVRAACHRTRLAIYALLERLFVRECTCMKLVMAATTKDQSFPVAGRPHAFAERFPFFSIFHFLYMIHPQRAFPRLPLLAFLFFV